MVRCDFQYLATHASYLSHKSNKMKKKKFHTVEIIPKSHYTLIVIQVSENDVVKSAGLILFQLFHWLQLFSSKSCLPNGWFVVWFMVFNTTFNNISVISWRSVLLVEETGIPGENYRPVASHWQILSHNVVSSTPLHERGSNSQL